MQIITLCHLFLRLVRPLLVVSLSSTDVIVQ